MSWGLISYNLLERFGLFTEASIFASPNAAALLAPDPRRVWRWTPFMMLAFLPGCGAPGRPYRAAAVRRRRPSADLFRLTLPMSAPCCGHRPLAPDRCLQVFDTIFLLTGGGPARSPSRGILAYSGLRVLEGRGASASRPWYRSRLRLLQPFLPRRPQTTEHVLGREEHRGMHGGGRDGRPISWTLVVLGYAALILSRRCRWRP